jgi:hypothetical protein
LVVVRLADSAQAQSELVVAVVVACCKQPHILTLIKP